MKVSLSFLWYDLWVGAFWDRARRVLYVCPLPCVVLRFEFAPKPLKCGACSRGDHNDCSGWCFCPKGPCDE